MNLFLEHTVSREFWRRVYPTDRSPKNPAIFLPDGDCVSSRKDYLNLAPSWALSEQTLSMTGNKTHCMVLDRRRESRNPHHNAHTWTTKLPEGSFYQLSCNLFVSSPEFSFLQMANCVDIRELIAYGDEICGRYSFDKTKQRGFRDRAIPLTTREKMCEYVKRSKGCRGYDNASRALRYIVDDSASPMETTIEMLNTLPCKKLGGYALSTPEMNHQIPLSAKAALIAQQQNCYGDMCYPGIKLDIEYLGQYDHNRIGSFDADRARVNAIIEMGYEVLEITYQQVIDLERYEAIVEHISKRLGERIRSEHKGYLDERVRLRQILFSWNQSGGIPSYLR